MACNCNYLLFFVLLLIVKTDKHLSLLWKKARSLSHVPLFATLWTVAYQAPPSMGFSRQEYWSGLPSSPPGDLLGPEIEPKPLTSSPALAGRFFITSATWEAPVKLVSLQFRGLRIVSDKFANTAFMMCWESQWGEGGSSPEFSWTKTRAFSAVTTV